MEEEWVTKLTNFPGYRISSYGVITDPEGKNVPYYMDEDKWFGSGLVPFVKLNYDMWSFEGPVWRLMMREFFDGNDEGVRFEYIDEDVHNLNLDNLIPIHVNEKTGQPLPIRWKLNSRKYRYLDRRLGRRIKVVETGDIFDSVAECARELGGNSTNIYAVLRGAQKSYLGHHFEYIM